MSAQPDLYASKRSASRDRLIDHLVINVDLETCWGQEFKEKIERKRKKIFKEILKMTTRTSVIAHLNHSNLPVTESNCYCKMINNYKNK